MKPLNTPHDTGYKWLLSSRTIFIQFLRSFVKQPWVDALRETDLKRTEKSFISKDFQEKEADLVYEANLQGRTVFFYILLELQSSVDFSMPYRLLNYMSGIWQNHLNLLPQEEHLGQKNFRLPAIVPIVLYNGVAPWTAAMSLEEMIEGYETFDGTGLNLKYTLIAVNQYTDEDLLQLSNIIGAVFLLDKKDYDAQTFRNQLQKLFHALQEAPKRELQIFARWVHYIIKPHLSPKQQQALDEEIATNFEGEVTMFFSNIEKTLDTIKQEALTEGRMKGLTEGRMEEKEQTAREMLRDRIHVDTIAKYTKLPLDRIHALAKQL